jgi:flagellar biosynthesis chaperone FliJ
MSRDSLHVLMRLRHFQVNTAQRDLAAGLRAVADAEDAQRAAGTAHLHEAAVATTLAADTMPTAVLCRWLQRGRAEVEAANSARDAAEEAVGRGRAALAAAHAAAEAVDMLRADQVRVTRRLALRTEQAALDEHAARDRLDGSHDKPAQ